MLQNKSNKILSEISSFFTSSEKGVLKTIELFKVLNLSNIKLCIVDFNQAFYKKESVLLILLLFPLFSVKNIRQAMQNRLTGYFDAKKDVYYRFKNNPLINWRRVLSTVNRRLFKSIDKSSETKKTNLIKCLIIDDTDLEKSGKYIEHISRIWSHVFHRHILGFKGLFIGYWDGKSFFGLDFSLHKEKGKNKKSPFGFKPTQLKKQYKKKREKTAPGYKRVSELLIKKTDNAISLIKKVLRTDLVVDYILMDSWFVNDKMIKFVKNIKGEVHLIGMLKNGNSKYIFQQNELTAKQIANKLQKRKKVKRVRSLNMYVGESVLTYKGSEIKVFFCKTSKRGKWHLLVSTNTALSIEVAYRIYSNRWSIEVFFKECKQYFGLGKSQSQDFDGQIADITMNMVQYNLLSAAKRFVSYETMGQLFQNLQDNMRELTISEKIWGFILELLQIVADIFNSDFNELIINILKSDEKENRLVNLIEHSYLKAA